jgi:hypothetical protein
MMPSTCNRLEDGLSNLPVATLEFNHLIDVLDSVHISIRICLTKHAVVNNRAGAPNPIQSCSVPAPRRGGPRRTESS